MCCWAAGGGNAAVLSVQHCSWGVSNTPQSHILSGRAASHQKNPETVLTAAPGNPSWLLMSLPAHCLPAIACVPAQVRRGRSSGASSGLDLAHLNELDLWKHVADAMTLLANKANTSESNELLPAAAAATAVGLGLVRCRDLHLLCWRCRASS